MVNRAQNFTNSIAAPYCLQSLFFLSYLDAQKKGKVAFFSNKSRKQNGRADGTISFTPQILVDKLTPFQPGGGSACGVSLSMDVSIEMSMAYLDLTIMKFHQYLFFFNLIHHNVSQIFLYILVFYQI